MDSPTTNDCPICEGLGWVRVDVPLDDPGFGKAIRCICKAKTDDVSLTQRLVTNCRLPGGLHTRTFGNFYPGWSGRRKDSTSPNSQTIAYRQKALDATLRWVEKGGWLILQGPYSSGKTHLAAAAANGLVAKGKPVVFACVPDLLDGLRDHVAKPDFMETFEGLKEAPALVLDDLGSEYETEWAMEKMTQLYDYRANYELPLLTTSNAARAELPARIVARLDRVGAWLKLG